MKNDSDIYISLPEGTTLTIYRHKGVLCVSGEECDVSKEIALIIKNSVNGLKLKETLNAMSYENKSKGNRSKRILLGLLALVSEGKLKLTKTCCDNCGQIINRENIFYPQGMHVELTRSCNLKCYYCYKDAVLNVSERLETKTLLEILKELKKRGLRVVELTGGEPLLHPDFLSILDFCYHNFSVVSVLSNGTLITEEFVEQILLYKDKLVFSISLDSCDELEYERKSGIKGSFKKVVDGIKRLTQKGFFVRASMAVDEGNWQQIERTLLFAKSLNVAKFTYSPIIPVGRANNQVVWRGIDIDMFASLEKKLVHRYPDFIHTLEGHSIEELLAPGGCGAGSRTFVMNESGIVRMCATDEKYGVIGDLKRQTVDEVFANQICALISELVFPNSSVCDGCVYLTFCAACPIKTRKQIELIGEDNCRWIQKNSKAREWYQLSGQK